jgi:hypothetical protein
VRVVLIQIESPSARLLLPLRGAERLLAQRRRQVRASLSYPSGGDCGIPDILDIGLPITSIVSSSRSCAAGSGGGFER